MVSFLLFNIILLFSDVITRSHVLMDPANHLSGCGSVDDDFSLLLENQNVDLEEFWTQFSSPSTTYSAPSSFVPRKNAIDMAGGDFSSIDAWLADGDEDTRAGDGPSRKGDADPVAPGVEDSRADQHGPGLADGHAGEAARAGGATQHREGCFRRNWSRGR